MKTIEQAISDFLNQERIAVMGVSRSGREASNAIFDRLADAGHDVYAVNPKADEIDGVRCYHSLEEIPGGVGAVMIATTPKATNGIIEDCQRLGIQHVWIHHTFGQGSLPPGPLAGTEAYVRSATPSLGRGQGRAGEGGVDVDPANGMTVITGGCPMMFVEPVDIFHRCSRWIFQRTGTIPAEV